METSLICTVLNGLSHLQNVRSKAHFAVCLIRGLGGNLSDTARTRFAKDVFELTGETPPDSKRVLDAYYDVESGRLNNYRTILPQDLSHEEMISKPPVVLTEDTQRYRDYFRCWLEPNNRQPFIVAGPDGCGKG